MPRICPKTIWVLPTGSHLTSNMLGSYINISLSLIGLVALAGAGVAIGSGVGMAALAMAEEEKKQQGSAAIAHSVIEKKPAPATGRGFAASNQ